MSVSTASAARVDAPQADLALAELARRHGTPLYVYDLSLLGARVTELRGALHEVGARLFFATMANDRLPVLSRLAQLGVGACVNSLPHLSLARETGFAKDLIQYTSTGIPLDDLRTLAADNVRVNLDSLAQLEAWLALGRREAGIRVNAASLTGRLDGDRIGIDAHLLSDAVRLARSRDARIVGVHVYVGTNFQTPEEMLPTLDAFFQLAGTLPDIAYVNVGGGIGVDYAHAGPGFDVVTYGVRLAELAGQLRDRAERPVEVICEPGRALSAGCAHFVTAVTDIKQLSGRRFVAVDGSIAVFPRPLHHPDSPHRIRRLVSDREPQDEFEQKIPSAIVGRTTYSRDILGSSVLPSRLPVGTLLAFEDAGAYCQSMASRFLGQPDPWETFLE